METELTDKVNNKKKILEILLIPCIVFNILSFEVPIIYDWAFYVSIVLTLIVVGLLINEIFDYELENKTKDESVSEALRLVMATRHQ